MLCDMGERSHAPAYFCRTALLHSSEWVGGTDCCLTMAMLGCPHPLRMGGARPQLLLSWTLVL